MRGGLVEACSARRSMRRGFAFFFFFFIVSRNLLCLQMIFMDKIGFPDVPLEVYLILNFHFHVVF